ncbi:MAG: amino acid permease [Gemmatimonadetes bacterium]|nr:amino acid permease [Gemmatimonadota bacterium]
MVVANMIGTGVFTSLGFQLVDIESGFVLLMLWVVGGITAFCGALTYAELGATIRRSGGEYIFLSRIYHPAAGFVSGWISATVGFSAPTALAAITFGTYLSSVFPSLSPTWLAVGLVVLLSAVHGSARRNSSFFQRWFTTLKVALIVAFCVAAAVLVGDPQPVDVLPTAASASGMLSGAFAVSLIYVSYAYAGWNAATYLTSEIDEPQRVLPRVLGGGTLVVMILYVGLNWAFLHAAPVEELVGRLEVGYVAAGYIFGPRGADIMGVTLALLLVSTVSAMVLAGPRVLHAIGEDYPVFRFLERTNRHGVPAVAVYTQAAICLTFILTASFENILVFSGFTMGLNTFLAALGVFVLRRREPELERPYRAWGYPFTPIVFLALTGWTLVYLLIDRPVEAGMGLGIVATGLLIYGLARLAAASRLDDG